MNYFLPFVVCAIFLSQIGCQSASSKIHEHGTAHLRINADENDLHVELLLPAQDVLGFEKEIQTDSEKKLVEAQSKYFKNPRRWIRLPNEPGCAMEGSPDVDYLYVDGHFDFEIDIEYNCKNNNDLNEVIFTGFTIWKNIKQVKASGKTPKGRFKSILNDQNKIFNLKK